MREREKIYFHISENNHTCKHQSYRICSSHFYHFYSYYSNVIAAAGGGGGGGLTTTTTVLKLICINLDFNFFLTCIF